jgi:hypothetical protein
MARHHAIMGHEMATPGIEEIWNVVIEHIGEAHVRLPHVHGLLARRECGRISNPQNFSWLYEGIDDIVRQI